MENNDWLAKYEAKHNTPAKRESKTKVISTSYQEIDEALGINGLPLGKVIDIAGESNVGKTALVYDIIASAQDKNLACVYLDLDRKFDADFAGIRHVKLDELLIFQPASVEPIVPACLQLMEQGLADLIIFDSISNLNLEPTLNIGFKDIINPLLQKILDYQTSLIFLSQIRQDMKEGGIVTPQNVNIDDVANVRIMLRPLGGIKHLDVLIGKNVEVDIYKNDLASPGKTKIELFI